MTSDRASATSVTPAWRRSLVLVLSGVPGVLSLWLVLPELPGVAPATVLLQPALLLAIAAFAGSWLGQLMLLGWSVALFYHLLNGIRHLFWDTGRGFDLATMEKSGKAVVAGTVVLTALAWLVAKAG